MPDDEAPKYDTPGELVPTNLTDLNRLAAITSGSGLYGRDETPRSSAVRIMLGMEMGMTPMQALSNVYVVDGKPSLGAHGIAMMLKRSKKYDYRVLERTDQVCRIEYRELVKDPNSDKFAWEAIGEASFSLEQAQRAGLAGKHNWKAYPDDMLYARAMARGARTYCPDALGGAVHDPDELEKAPALPESSQKKLSRKANVAVEAPEASAETVIEGEAVEVPPEEPVAPEEPVEAPVTPAPPGSAENPHPEPVPLATKKPRKPKAEPLPEPEPEPEGEVVPESETEMEPPDDPDPDSEPEIGYGDDDNEGPVERAAPFGRGEVEAGEPTAAALHSEEKQATDVAGIKALLQSFNKTELRAILEGSGEPGGWKFGNYARWLYEQNDHDVDKTFEMIGVRAASVGA